MTETFKRGVVVISLDTERIWGYRDCLDEAGFEARFPHSPDVHPKLLDRLGAAAVSATWFVVGGLALRDGPNAARRVSSLAEECISIPNGDELSAPLWYCSSFLEGLQHAQPAQEIGLHGGLTHLVWKDPRVTREIARCELTLGLAALGRLGISPRSFSYPRNGEKYHDLLPEHGLQCFRGAPPSIAWKLGQSIPGALLRAWEELRRASPPVVWPQESQPGLWTIPASMFLYPIGPARERVLPLRSRVARFQSGLDAAARQRGIFHFCFHPENLAESASGFSLLDELLERLILARERGDIEVMTVTEAVAHMERQTVYDVQRQQYPDVLKAHRRA